MTHVAPVTVVISTRDRADALGRCLDALWAGEVRPAEIVVVDQSADDATGHVVREREGHGLPVRLVRQARLGLGASQNLAVRTACHALVAVLDDDCVADARWLATIVASFAADPALDVLAGRVLPLPAAGDRVCPVSSRPSTVRRDFDRRGLPWDVGSGNNFALRRERFLAIGGCDERLGPGSPAHGGVDMDLFHRLLRAGARVRYEPEALVRHERQTRAERMARRPMYGRGMGAAIALWLRAGDRSAVRVLGAWVLLRTRLLAAALRRREWHGAREELVMLGSTARGLRHGFTVRDRPRAAETRQAETR